MRFGRFNSRFKSFYLCSAYFDIFHIITIIYILAGEKRFGMLMGNKPIPANNTICWRYLVVWLNLNPKIEPAVNPITNEVNANTVPLNPHSQAIDCRYAATITTIIANMVFSFIYPLKMGQLRGEMGQKVLIQGQVDKQEVQLAYKLEER